MVAAPRRPGDPGEGPQLGSALTLPELLKRLAEAARPVLNNPFVVLGVSPEASARELEREGARILALIAAGLDAPARPRSAEDVRQALSELRAPERRALHELLCLGPLAEPDVEAARELLQAVPLAAPGSSPLHVVLPQLAGELVPLPPPAPPLADAERLLKSLQPAPVGNSPVCVDSLGLELP